MTLPYPSRRSQVGVNDVKDGALDNQHISNSARLDLRKLAADDVETDTWDTPDHLINTLSRIRYVIKAIQNTTNWDDSPPTVLNRLQGWVADDAQNPSLGTLPANTYVTNVRIHVTELFNSDGADNISVGYDADNVAFCTATDVSSTGVLAPTLGSLAGYNGTARAVEAYYVNGGSEPTTGKALITVEYYRVSAAPA